MPVFPIKSDSMELSVRHRILFSVGALIAFVLGQIVIIKTCSFQAKAIIFRAEFVAVMESVLLFFSWMIWRTFSPLPTLLFRSNSSNGTGTLASENVNLSRPSLRKCKNSDVDLVNHDSRENLLNSDNNDIPMNFPTYFVSLWRIILLLYLGMCHLSYLTNLFLTKTDPHWFGMLSYACLGSFVQLITGLAFFKLLSFILKGCKKIMKFSRGTSGLHRKHVALLAILYMLSASMLGLYTASQPPSVKEVKIPVKDLPSNLEGLVILQLSDIHLGPTVGFSKLKRIVDMVNSEKPDIVVLTGDLVDGSVERLKGAAQPLSDIVSKYGNFFATGNHEYYTGDVDNWFTLLEFLGFQVLHNSHVQIPSKASKGQGQICLAGTDDIQADKIGYGEHKFDLPKAVGSCPQNEPVVLLAHQPAAAKKALDSSFRVDLVLSGHTHGGQMFPLIIGAYFMNPFYAGLYPYGQDGSHVYVSQGTQYWGIPMRIATSMEISRIILHKYDNV